MKVLFFTQENFYQRKNGAQHYSYNAVNYFANKGFSVDCLVLRESGKDFVVGNVALRFVSKPQRGLLLSNLSLYPRMVFACYHSSVINKYIDGLGDYDLIVFDHLATCSYLENFSQVPVLHISHNDEVSSKRSFLMEVPGLLLKFAHFADYIKLYFFQNKVFNKCQAVTFISNSEFRYFEQKNIRASSYLLEPYRCIDSAGFKPICLRPKIIAVVGTFLWTPKKIALKKLLDEWKSQAHGLDIVLRIAGVIDKDIVDYVNGLNMNIQVVHNFNAPEDVLFDARIGLMIDGAGGGFKIKFLDYFSNGVSIYSLMHDSIGPAMVSMRNCRLFEGLSDLVCAAISDVDNPDLLSKLVTQASSDFEKYTNSEEFNSVLDKVVADIC